MAHKLQLGLTSEYERFNGNTAYVAGSTTENPQAVMMFFGLPNNWPVERIESSIGDASQFVEAKRIIHAANNYDALRAQNAQLLAAAKRIAAYGNVYRYRDTETSPYEQLIAAIAAAESEEQ